MDMNEKEVLRKALDNFVEAKQKIREAHILLDENQMSIFGAWVDITFFEIRKIAEILEIPYYVERQVGRNGNSQDKVTFKYKNFEFHGYDNFKEGKSND